MIQFNNTPYRALSIMQSQTTSSGRMLFLSASRVKRHLGPWHDSRSTDNDGDTSSALIPEHIFDGRDR
jgi:hypothetical protein